MESSVSNQLNTSHIQSAVGGRSIISFARLCRAENPAGLQTEIVNLLSQTWVDHVNTRDYSGGWDALPLRCPRAHSQSHPLLQSFAIAGNTEWEIYRSLITVPISSRCWPTYNVLLNPYG